MSNMNNQNTIDFENVVQEGPDATLESPDGAAAGPSKASDFSPPPDSNLFDPIAEEKVADDFKEAQEEPTEPAPATEQEEQKETTVEDHVPDTTDANFGSCGSVPADETTTDSQEEAAEEKAPDPPVQTSEDDDIDMVDFVLEGKRALTRKITRNTSANPSAAGENASISPEAIHDSAEMDKIHDVAEMA